MSNQQPPTTPAVVKHSLTPEPALSFGPDVLRVIESNDRAYLAHSRKLVILCIDGWQESTGINGEFRIAAEAGLPIEFMLDLSGETVTYERGA